MRVYQYLAMVACGSAGMMGVALPAAAQENTFGKDRAVSVPERMAYQYQPLGINLGGFIANANAGLNVGTTDNVYYTQNDRVSDTFAELTPAVTVSSKWGRHALNFDLNSRIRRLDKATSENTTSYAAGVSGRVDVSSFAFLQANYRHNRDFEDRSSYLAFTDAVKPVRYDTDSLSLGTVITGNRVRFIGSVDRTESKYSDVASRFGGVIVQALRNGEYSSVSGRVEYSYTPDIAIFVNVVGSKQKYNNDPQRDNDGILVAAGGKFDLTNLLRGELQVGSQTVDFKGSAQGKYNNSYVQGKVEWFPTQLTTVHASVNRSYSATPLISASSAVNTSLVAGVDHELLRNLVLSGEVSRFSYDFEGLDREDRINQVKVGARYYLSRRLQLKADIAHQTYDSSGANAVRTYDLNSIRVGVVASY